MASLVLVCNVAVHRALHHTFPVLFFYALPSIFQFASFYFKYASKLGWTILRYIALHF